MRSLFRFTCLFALFAFPAALLAQTASVTGTVTDSSGAVVQGATVTAKNSQTGAERNAQTNASGGYSITTLPVGNYNISVSKSGFEPVNYNSVQLTVAQILTLNAKMPVAHANESVEVSGGTVAPIDLQTAQLSNVVDEQHINELPLLTRNPYELVLLAPGTNQTNSGLGGFSINGERERNNNFLLDGVDNNDTSVPGIPSGLLSSDPDATQEFRVITNNFLPEFGRNTGGIVDVVTKSGTNQFHGDAYWFGRYSATAARDYFNPGPDPKNPFVRNDFGFSIGGPIIKDRTFFFENTEWQRFRTTLTNVSIVPNQAFHTGIFTLHDSAGNPIPIDVSTPGSPDNAFGLPLDPQMQQILALMPPPNGPAVDDLRGELFFPSKSAQDTATVAFRLDQKITDKHNLFLRYAYNGFNDPNPFHSDVLPDGLGAIGSNQQAHSIAAGLTSAFTSNRVNEFRFGVNRTDDPFFCENQKGVDGLSPLDPFGRGTDYFISGVLGGNGLGCGGLGDSNGQSRRTGTWSYTDNFTWVHGNHTLKFGGEFRYVFENGFDSFFSRPSVTFSNFSFFGAPSFAVPPPVPGQPSPCDSTCGSLQNEDMVWALFGLPAEQSQSQFFNKAGTRTADDFRRFRQHEYGTFAQDEWKVTQNLTLDFGLRYQFNGVPFEVDNNLSNLFVAANGPGPFTFQTVGPGTGRMLYNNDSKNFEPRVGFAWDPFKDGKTSIRGGFGIFHDRVFGNLFGNARGNPPFQSSFVNFPIFLNSFVDTLAAPPTQVPSATVPNTITLGGVIPGFPTEASVVIFDPNLKIPYSESWNFGIQHQITNSLTIEANYVGDHGLHQLRVVDGNPPNPALIAGALACGIDPSSLQFSEFFGATCPGGASVGPFVNNTALFEPALNKSTGFSKYNALQLNVTQRQWHGLQIQGAYTWSHDIDDSNDPLVSAFGNRNFPRNSLNLKEEIGNSDFDIRHRAVINYIYQFPFGHGQRWLQHGVGDKVVGGWELTGITTLQTGHPYDIFGNRDSELTGFSSRGFLVGDPSIPGDAPKTETGPPVSAFTLAPFGQPGNIGRNHFYGPGYANFNAVVQKTFDITERTNLVFRMEAYNVFNRTQFQQPDNLIQDGSSFGFSSATIVNPDGTSSARQLQFALKLKF